jgi:uncharacterized paraquat-inducible protein A
MGMFDFLKPKDPLRDSFGDMFNGNFERGKRKLFAWADAMDEQMAIAQKQHDDELVERIANRIEEGNSQADRQHGTVFCTSCGTPLKQNAKFCSQCGTNIR